MINILRYEPRNQRQQFEPRERQRGEHQEQDRHIHLHIHLNLTFRARQKRSLSPPDSTRVARIVAAFVGATVLPLWLLGASAMESATPTLATIGVIFLVGLAIAGGGCFALLLSHPRSTLRAGILLALFLLLPVLLPCLVLVFPLWILRILSQLLIALLLYGHPLVSAISLAYVSRQAGAFAETSTVSRKRNFVVVSGMLLMLLGGLLLNLFALLSAGPPLQLWPFLPAMCGAVIIAMFTLFRLFRQRKHTRAHPKDASPFDV